MQWRNLSDDKELRKRVVMQHDDVYDIGWSPNGRLIACGSVNHITYIWDVKTSRSVSQLRDHTHFVQGVCWDPHGQYLATQGSDRTVRLYGFKEDKSLEKKRKAAASSGKPKPVPLLPGWLHDNELNLEAFRCLRTLKHLSEPSPTSTELGNPAALALANEISSRVAKANDISNASTPTPITSEVVAVEDTDVSSSTTANKRSNVKAPLYVDESLPSFFRRLDWTPDGAFLISPSGIMKPDAVCELKIVCY